MIPALVLSLMAEGYDRHAIARRLDVSFRSVKTIVCDLMDEAGVRNQEGLVGWALRSGWVR